MQTKKMQEYSSACGFHLSLAWGYILIKEPVESRFLMDSIIFAVGLVVMVMVIGGCYLSMMLAFTSGAKKDD